jgi:hypothetical protein
LPFLRSSVTMFLMKLLALSGAMFSVLISGSCAGLIPASGWMVFY